MLETVDIILNYSEYRSGGEVCKGQENDAYPSYEPTYIRFEPDCFSAKFFKNPSVYEEHFQVPKSYLEKDILYLAVIFYGDGDTFGQTEGNPYFVGVSDSYSGAKQLIKYKLENSNNYAPWCGYFSSFGGQEVFELPLIKNES